MSALTLRWERETDEKEICLHANRESTDSLLENCCGLTELTCAVPWERPHQALDVRATRTRETSNQSCDTSVETIMTVRPTTLNLEAVKRDNVELVLTRWDSDRAGDADRFSVSGTSSWLRGKLGWYPITASSRKVNDRTQVWRS